MTVLRVSECVDYRRVSGRAGRGTGRDATVRFGFWIEVEQPLKTLTHIIQQLDQIATYWTNWIANQLGFSDIPCFPQLFKPGRWDNLRLQLQSLALEGW